jgi:hypothetical protein
MIETDLHEIDGHLPRHQWTATQPDGSGDIVWQPGRQHLLIRGAPADCDAALSSVGQFLDARGFQFALLRVASHLEIPNLRHSSLVTVGSVDALPDVDEVLDQLQRPKHNVQILLTAGDEFIQGECLAELFERLEAWIEVCGRPHALLVPTFAEVEARGLLLPEKIESFECVIACAVGDESVTDVFPHDSNVVTCDASHWVH